MSHHPQVTVTVGEQSAEGDAQLAPLAFDAGLRHTFGQFTKAEFDGQEEDLDDVSTNTTRIDLGLAWYPGARR